MSSTKSFGMLVRGYRGRGVKIAVIADIARHRRNRERQNLTASASNPYHLGWVGMNRRGRAHLDGDQNQQFPVAQDEHRQECLCHKSR